MTTRATLGISHRRSCCAEGGPVDCKNGNAAREAERASFMPVIRRLPTASLALPHIVVTRVACVIATVPQRLVKSSRFFEGALAMRLSVMRWR